MLDTKDEDVERAVVWGAEVSWRSMVVQPWEAHKWRHSVATARGAGEGGQGLEERVVRRPGGEAGKTGNARKAGGGEIRAGEV